MIKSELVEVLCAERPSLAKKDVVKIVDLFFEEITAAIVAGRPVELRGLGRFSLREYQAREARNPRTGASVVVDASRRVRFKASRKVLGPVDPLR